ncbi:hypothetical protein RI543_003715 [Arxiozyma heterogenica]|uniref:Zn(2)-C6 fungal-type domain-containing protein n=1 Tax=Arxiozyma heterogenica TaxID=278026 RepID=A0AAN7WNJ8_9SACH|nr:hypothetical protein RI543_003715 [Kazachstania heterogenica]
MGRPKKEISEEKFEQFQREVELAGNRTDILLRDKKGRSRSCLLCRRRKQRCDHKLPTCTACLKAGVKCIQPAKYQSSSTNSKDNIIPTTNNVGLNNDNNCNINNCTLGNDRPLIISNYSISPVNSKNSLNSNGLLSINNINNGNNSFFVNSNSNIIQTTNFNTTGKITKSNPNSDSDKDEYTKLLEKKLRFLEKLIDISPNTVTFKKKIKQYKRITHLLNNMDDTFDELDFHHPNNGPDNKFDSTYYRFPYNNHNTKILPPLNSQFFDPNNNTNSISATSANRTEFKDDYYNRMMGTSLPRVASQNSKYDTVISLTSKSLKDFDLSSCIFSKYDLKEFLAYKPVMEFDEELSRSFLDTFFTRLQFKYPLLDEQEIYSFHEHFVNNNIYSYSESDFHFSCGRMWLVYTISACLQMTTGKYKGNPPMNYFSTAIRHVAKCGRSLNYVQQVELLTLLVLYLLRTDKDSLVLYEIIKDVMTICKEKLYLNKWHSPDPFANKKLRLFWCIYLLERMICVAVGKPYTITESEIDLPYFTEDSFNTKDTKTHNGVNFINQSLKLRRTESNFVEQLKIIPQKPEDADSTPNNSNNKKLLIKQLPEVRKIFKDLEVWRSGLITSSFKNFENETLKLYYYRAVRLLIQPYLEVLPPDDRLFRECQAAAGQICQLYKIFHQKTVTGHSTPAVHTVFVAGVTLIYCMWLARNFGDKKRRKLGDDSKHTRPLVSATLFSTMDDLRACSVCLYVITERSNFARIFRDAFEQLMNATVGNLIERCGPNSSELIYMANDTKNGQHKASNSYQKKKTQNITDEDTTLMSSDQDGRINDKASNNNNISKENSNYETTNSINGMPPAMNRTFGKGQAEEHAGFVANSQVDPAEQKELNRKKGILQKATLPKSLAHLLINEDNEDEKSFNRPETESCKKSTADTPSNSLKEEEEDGSSPTTSINDDTKRYIVKKPVNLNEFNWENFEHQAFLQQHYAQQNLQVYLTSLNYNKTDNNNNKQFPANVNVNTTTNNGNGIIPYSNLQPYIGTQPTLPANLNSTNSQSTNIQQNYVKNMNSHKSHNSNDTPSSTTSTNTHVPISTFNDVPIQPVSEIYQSTNINRTRMGNTSYPGAPVIHGPMVNNNNNSNNTFSTIPVSTMPLISMSNNNNNIPNNNNVMTITRNNEVTSSGVLFNNGTHDMINNISTWTNDSANELLSHSNYNYSMFNLEPTNPIPTDSDKKNMTHFSTNNNVTSHIGSSNSVNLTPTSTVTNTATTNNNNNSNNNDSILHPQDADGCSNENNQPIRTNEPNNRMINHVDVNQSNNGMMVPKRIGTISSDSYNNNLKNSQNKIANKFVTKTRFPDNFAPVEDFWTVNDDYEFLT